MFSKSLLGFFVLMVLALTSACDKSSDSSPAPGGGNEGTQGNNWPAYLETPLAGKMFGKDWSLVTALARKASGNNNELVVDLYAETASDACKNLAFPSKAYASIVIPTNYAQTEYLADTNNLQAGGNPLVFTLLESTSRNLMAERTKLKITSLTDSGFEALLYAYGKEQDGTPSEINGKINVVDCSKAKTADFSTWEEMAGSYSLYSYGGVRQDDRSAFMEIESQTFYDRTRKTWVPALIMPLYASVSAGSDMTYSFGPMKGLGQSKISEINGKKTLQYSYKGPVYTEGIDITLNLDITVEIEGDFYSVQYTLEIPSHVNKVSKNFILKKNNWR